MLGKLADWFLGRPGQASLGESWPRCYRHALPAVCFGADLVAPKHRCPRCCRADQQFDGVHGSDGYLAGHEHAEGVSV